MATLKSIRKRIISVKNTQKITKAMKMVSAAKLRRAQQRLVQARPYAEKMRGLVANVASLVPADAHPLLARRESVKKVEFLILSSDRGLCGGFNGNLLRKIEKVITVNRQYSHNQAQRAVEGEAPSGFARGGGDASPYGDAQVSIVGKKGRDFFVARKVQPENIQTGIYDTFDFGQAMKLAEEITTGFLSGKFDEFYLAYNQFRSAISQIPTVQKILPFELTETSTPGETASEEDYVPEYLYEPNRSELLNKILPRALATSIYRAFLESMAGEQGARMAAMDSATNNCREMIRRLTLQLNRLRQAAITKELMDIVNGKEALG